MDIAVGSEQGVFSKQNSDACLSGTLTSKAMFFGVADGFGSLDCDMSPALMALISVRDYLHGRAGLGVNGGNASGPAAIRMLLLAALDHANSRLYAFGRSHEDFVGSGASLTVAVVVGRSAFVGHTGDARAYLLRFGHIEPITKDDALFCDALAGVKPGLPAKSRLRGALWRSLGTQAKLEASVIQVDLLPGDQLLLCTDGMHRCISADEMCEVLLEAYTASDVVARLLATAKMRGGVDNATLLVGRDLLAPPPNPAAEQMLSLAKRPAEMLLLLSVLLLVLFFIAH